MGMAATKLAQSRVGPDGTSNTFGQAPPPPAQTQQQQQQEQQQQQPQPERVTVGDVFDDNDAKPAPSLTVPPLADTTTATTSDSDPPALKKRVKIKPKARAKQAAKAAAAEEEEVIDETDARQRFLRDKRKREKEAQAIVDKQAAVDAAAAEREAAEIRKQEGDRAAFQRELAAGSTDQRSKRGGGFPTGGKTTELTVEDLYGEGKAYPEPYPAGKVPGAFVHERHKARAEKKHFLYTVKYRSGKCICICMYMWVCVYCFP